MDKLTGSQYQQLTNALFDAFNVQRFEQMLQFKLDKRLDRITLAADFQTVIFEVIKDAEAQGWTADLIRAALEMRPKDAALMAFAQQMGAALHTVDPAGATISPRGLERLLRQQVPFLDLNVLRSRLGAIETRVCRIEINTNRGLSYGTGFLVGPALLLTNYHVMEPVILGEQGQTTPQGLRATPADVTLRFDYKRLASGAVLNAGTTFRLDPDEWLLDASPMSATDGQPDAGLPTPDELDYALLQLDGNPGDMPPGDPAKQPPNAPPRGWVRVLDQAYDFASGSPLFIVQHPQGAPLKIALDTEAVIALNANQTRVTYRTNTEPGSSGSPCFNSALELVALHHVGDPAYQPTYNQGVPLAAILARLERQGLKAELLQAPPGDDATP